MTKPKKTRTLGMLLAALVLLLLLHADATTPAWARQGSVTISHQNNEKATYDAYLVFRADIDEQDHASNVSWPDDQTKRAVLSFLNENGYPSWLASRYEDPGQHDLAQNAAEYIAAMVTISETDAGAATQPRSTGGRSFASALARHLAREGISPTGTATTGEPFEGEQGLWLFVTTGTTIDAEGEAGTSPIWLPLGGSLSQVMEKSAVPTLHMEVMEDSSGTWGKVADAHRGQALSYRLTGTLPANIGSFPSYHYRFDVSLPKGVELDMAKDSTLSECLKVTVGGREVPIDGTNFVASNEGGHLSLDFADLRSSHWEGYGINGDSTITLEFPARLGKDATVGVPGNICSAQLTYTADPVTGVDGRSETVDVATFTYLMSIVKVDKQTKSQLGGAAFSIQVAQDNSDEQSRGLYVQEDGSLGTPVHTFETKADGTTDISGLDEGSYLINEVYAPEGYQAIGEPIKLSIESELSDVDRSLKGLRTTCDSQATTQVMVLPDKGALTLTVENARQEREVPPGPTEALAQTGVGPVAGMLVVAGAIVLLAAAWQRRS